MSDDQQQHPQDDQAAQAPQGELSDEALADVAGGGWFHGGDIWVEPLEDRPDPIKIF
jgi:hypothetical protein